MSYFAVIRDAGPAWADGKGAFVEPWNLFVGANRMATIS
jgi:hypothetical protein